MAILKTFKSIRPDSDIADKVAALPYDVYDRAEAKIEVERQPLSFLKIDRAETSLSDDVAVDAPEVYEHAKELFLKDIENGVYLRDADDAYYIYELTMDGRSQTGLVGLASIDDYVNGVIKKHENTREDKEADRIHHVDTLSAQTGPIFLAYRKEDTIKAVIERIKKETPLYDFVAPDKVRHRVWKIADEGDTSIITKSFANIPSLYIADGHHRAASAVKVGLKRREENTGYDKDAEFNFFLSVLFPEDELYIMDYNRTVKDLNGLSEDEFMKKVEKSFDIERSDEKVRPDKKGTFGMYLSGKWYKLSVKQTLYEGKDVVGRLDVSILQDALLEPILGISDPRTDERIAFIGGIRGLSELEKRADTDMKISFSMYPTSITELFEVADAGLLMPPKSTWFEPKLRSGLFIHEI